MNPIDIRNFIDVSTGIQPVPATRRLFNTCLFIFKGSQVGNSRVSYFTSASDVATFYGSNTSAAKAATIYFGGGVDVSPSGLYVANINSGDTSTIATTDVSATTTKFTYSGLVADDSWVLLTAREALNQVTYATMTYIDALAVTHTETVYLFITDLANKEFKAYSSRANFVSGTPIDMTDIATATSINFVLSSDSLGDAFAELLDDPRFYMITADTQAIGTENAFTVDEVKEMALSTNASSKVTHFFFASDMSETVQITDAATDIGSTSSVTGYIYSARIKKAASIVSDPDKREEYHAIAAASYFAGVAFTTARPMGTLAWKVISGITSNTLYLSAYPANTSEMAWQNINSKKGNCYITMGETGRTNFQAGWAGNGNDIGDIISGDYLNYTITYNIYDLLTIVPRLPMNSNGEASLRLVIKSAFERLYNAGVISAGTSTDGETFSGHGYNIYITIPTGTARAQGLWEDIYCTALLAGSTKKVVIQNTLKQ